MPGLNLIITLYQEDGESYSKGARYWLDKLQSGKLSKPEHRFALLMARSMQTQSAMLYAKAREFAEIV